MVLGESVTERRIPHIVPMVMAAYAKSFGRIDSNIRAIARRGWNPLNRGVSGDE